MIQWFLHDACLLVRLSHDVFDRLYRLVEVHAVRCRWVSLACYPHHNRTAGALYIITAIEVVTALHLDYTFHIDVDTTLWLQCRWGRRRRGADAQHALVAGARPPASRGGPDSSARLAAPRWFLGA